MVADDSVVFDAVVFVCYKCCFVPDHKTHAWIAARALVNRCDKLKLALARWFTTWFQAGGRPTASRREESLHTRTQYHQQQQTALCAALQVYHSSDFGGPVG